MVYDIILYVWIFLKLRLKWVQKCHFGTGLIIRHSVLGRFKKKKCKRVHLCLNIKSIHVLEFQRH